MIERKWRGRVYGQRGVEVEEIEGMSVGSKEWMEKEGKYEI